MKQKKRVAILLVCAMVIGMIAGCGLGFDAGKYVQGQLDNSYKNDSTLIVEQKVGTKEEAQQVYEDGIDTVVNNFFLGISVSDDVKDRYGKIFEDMFAKADYTVKEAEKQSDGSYVVTVEYKKMKIFGPTMDAVQAQADQIDVSSMDSYFNYMADIMEGLLSDGCEYEDAQTATVKVEISNKQYTINTTDLSNLTNNMFDVDAVSAN